MIRAVTAVVKVCCRNRGAHTSFGYPLHYRSRLVELVPVHILVLIRELRRFVLGVRYNHLFAETIIAVLLPSCPSLYVAIALRNLPTSFFSASVALKTGVYVSDVAPLMSGINPLPLPGNVGYVAVRIGKGRCYRNSDPWLHRRKGYCPILLNVGNRNGYVQSIGLARCYR